MLVLIPLLPLAVFVLFVASGAGVPTTVAALQGTVLVAAGLLMALGPRSPAAAAWERLLTSTTTTVWRGIDVMVVDAVVHGVGHVVRGWSAVLRRGQSGSVRGYAMAMLAGVVAMLGYFLWR